MNYLEIAGALIGLLYLCRNIGRYLVVAGQCHYARHLYSCLLSWPVCRFCYQYLLFVGWEFLWLVDVVTYVETSFPHSVYMFHQLYQPGSIRYDNRMAPLRHKQPNEQRDDIYRHTKFYTQTINTRLPFKDNHLLSFFY